MTSAAALTVSILAGCGGTTPSATVASPSPATSPTASGETIKTASNSRLGQILVDEEGKTVYLFVADKGTASTCYTDCAKFWPPVLTTGAPIAASGAQASLLGTTKRTDGTTEVTYAGHPLYYFLNDKKAGDTAGQGINGFGALWWVLSPTGAAITTK